MLKKKDIEKVRLLPLLKIIGFLLHIPAFMAVFSIAVCLYYGEKFGCFPLVIFSFFLLLSGQVFYRVFEKNRIQNLWEAMAGAALGWAVCSFIGALPYYIISKKMAFLGISNDSINVFNSYINSLFESFSGFTSTGLTMIKKPSQLPHILQFWRSFQSWMGGMGLLAFVIAIVESKKEEYRFYLAEAKSDVMGKDLRRSLLKIWMIYFIFTVLIAFLFFLARMPIWDAINHSMTSIATGGFSISDSSMEGYGFYAKLVALFGMTLGSMSFVIHYSVFIKRKISELWKDIQTRLFFIILIIGSILILVLNVISVDRIDKFDSIFSFFTCFSTCGFKTVDFSSFIPVLKLLLIIAMISGGCSGSTAGGIKIRRVRNVFLALKLRIAGMTKKHEEEIIEEIEKKKKKEITDIDLPKSEESSRLYSASVFVLIWILLLFVCSFVILLFSSHFKPLNVLFDVSSALGNVGISTGVVHVDLSVFSKIIFIFLMWLGRLEIIPAIILFISFFSIFKRKKIVK